MAMKLTDMKCVPCEQGTKPFNKKQIAEFKKQLNPGWKVVDDKKISRRVKFQDFSETMGFVSRVALMAQEEGHHPDMEVHYGYCVIEFYTHSVGGLSENDFIMAAKIDHAK
jgi:4a-hydroxytetrahydrobiopterin dehydratase